MIDHSIALLAFMFLVVAFARYLESRLVFVQKISSAVVCTLLGIFLANVGVPHAIGFTVELIQPHAYSWGYPEDAADVPVERLDWIAATVDDVGTASRRFEKLFGIGANLPAPRISVLRWQAEPEARRAPRTTLPWRRSLPLNSSFKLKTFSACCESFSQRPLRLPGSPSPYLPKRKQSSGEWLAD